MSKIKTLSKLFDSLAKIGTELKDQPIEQGVAYQLALSAFYDEIFEDGVKQGYNDAMRMKKDMKDILGSNEKNG